MDSHPHGYILRTFPLHGTDISPRLCQRTSTFAKTNLNIFVGKAEEGARILIQDVRLCWRRGAVRCGAARRGAAWCGAVRRGAVWRGAARRGAVRRGDST